MPSKSQQVLEYLKSTAPFKYTYMEATEIYKSSMFNGKRIPKLFRTQLQEHGLLVDNSLRTHNEASSTTVISSIPPSMKSFTKATRLYHDYLVGQYASDPSQSLATLKTAFKQEYNKKRLAKSFTTIYNHVFQVPSTSTNYSIPYGGNVESTQGIQSTDPKPITAPLTNHQELYSLVQPYVNQYAANPKPIESDNDLEVQLVELLEQLKSKRPVDTSDPIVLVKTPCIHYNTLDYTSEQIPNIQEELLDATPALPVEDSSRLSEASPVQLVETTLDLISSDSCSEFSSASSSLHHSVHLRTDSDSDTTFNAEPLDSSILSEPLEPHLESNSTSIDRDVTTLDALLALEPSLSEVSSIELGAPWPEDLSKYALDESTIPKYIPKSGVEYNYAKKDERLCKLVRTSNLSNQPQVDLGEIHVEPIDHSEIYAILNQKPCLDEVDMSLDEQDISIEPPSPQISKTKRRRLRRNHKRRKKKQVAKWKAKHQVESLVAAIYPEQQLQPQPNLDQDSEVQLTSRNPQNSSNQYKNSRLGSLALELYRAQTIVQMFHDGELSLSTYDELDSVDLSNTNCILLHMYYPGYKSREQIYKELVAEEVQSKLIQPSYKVAKKWGKNHKANQRRRRNKQHSRF